MKTEKEILEEIKKWEKTNEELINDYPNIVKKNEIYIKALKWVLGG